MKRSPGWPRLSRARRRWRVRVVMRRSTGCMQDRAIGRGTGTSAVTQRRMRPSGPPGGLFYWVCRIRPHRRRNLAMPRHAQVGALAPICPTRRASAIVPAFLESAGRQSLSPPVYQGERLTFVTFRSFRNGEPGRKTPRKPTRNHRKTTAPPTGRTKSGRRYSPARIACRNEMSGARRSPRRTGLSLIFPANREFGGLLGA